jgi:hypothetical protein
MIFALKPVVWRGPTHHRTRSKSQLLWPWLRHQSLVDLGREVPGNWRPRTSGGNQGIIPKSSKVYGWKLKRWYEKRDKPDTASLLYLEHAENGKECWMVVPWRWSFGESSSKNPPVSCFFYIASGQFPNVRLHCGQVNVANRASVHGGQFTIHDHTPNTNPIQEMIKCSSTVFSPEYIQMPSDTKDYGKRVYHPFLSPFTLQFLQFR